MGLPGQGQTPSGEDPASAQWKMGLGVLPSWRAPAGGPLTSFSQSFHSVDLLQDCSAIALVVALMAQQSQQWSPSLELNLLLWYVKL